MTMSRRFFLGAAPALATLLPGPATAVKTAAPAGAPPDSFPSHDPSLVREMVGVSHGNVARVRELLGAHPALARAGWDWGYGDWETALGAASHVGNREIAGLLIKAGAPVTIFSAAMLDQLDVVQAFVKASPGIERVKGPHGIPLLAHAEAGKAALVLGYLRELGGADARYRDDPIPDEDRAAIVGTYTFGPGSNQRFTVRSNTRGVLVIERAGAVERNLFHQGGRLFHPSGVDTVRIRFASGNPAPELRVEDGPLVVVATRVS